MEHRIAGLYAVGAPTRSPDALRANATYVMMPPPRHTSPS